MTHTKTTLHLVQGVSQEPVEPNKYIEALLIAEPAIQLDNVQAKWINLRAQIDKRGTFQLTSLCHSIRMCELQGLLPSKPGETVEGYVRRLVTVTFKDCRLAQALAVPPQLPAALRATQIDDGFEQDVRYHMPTGLAWSMSHAFYAIQSPEQAAKVPTAALIQKGRLVRVLVAATQQVTRALTLPVLAQAYKQPGGMLAPFFTSQNDAALFTPDADVVKALALDSCQPNTPLGTLAGALHIGELPARAALEDALRAAFAVHIVHIGR